MIALKSASTALILLAATAGASADVLVSDFFGNFNHGLGANVYATTGWEYGFSTTSTFASGAFSAFTDYTTTGDNGVARWSDLATENSLVPAAFYADSTHSSHFVGPNQAALHGGINGEIGVASYLVTTTRLYHVTGSFLTGDSGTVDNYVYAGGVPHVVDLGQGGSTPFDFYAYLTAGQTINFGVGTAGSFGNDTTPLVANISSVPGPLAALPFALMAVKRRRRKA